MAARGGWLDLVLLLNRLALGAYFTLAGWAKLKAGPFTFATTEFFVKARPSWLPPPVHGAYGYALPFVEVAAGVLLILGLYARTAASVIALLLASFILALGVAPRAGGPFEKNVVFFTLALLLVLLGPGRYAVRQGG